MGKTHEQTLHWRPALPRGKFQLPAEHAQAPGVGPWFSWSEKKTLPSSSVHVLEQMSLPVWSLREAIRASHSSNTVCLEAGPWLRARVRQVQDLEPGESFILTDLSWEGRVQSCPCWWPACQATGRASLRGKKQRCCLSSWIQPNLKPSWEIAHMATHLSHLCDFRVLPISQVPSSTHLNLGWLGHLTCLGQCNSGKCDPSRDREGGCM